MPLSLREQRRLVKRRASDPKGLHLTVRLLEHAFLSPPTVWRVKNVVFPCFLSPLLGGDPEDREIIGRGGL